MRKVVLLMIATLTPNPQLQVALCVLTLVAFLSLQLAYRPFEKQFHNLIEVAGLIALLIVEVALLLYSIEPSSWDVLAYIAVPLFALLALAVVYAALEPTLASVMKKTTKMLCSRQRSNAVLAKCSRLCHRFHVENWRWLKRGDEARSHPLQYKHLQRSQAECTPSMDAAPFSSSIVHSSGHKPGASRRKPSMVFQHLHKTSMDSKRCSAD